MFAEDLNINLPPDDIDYVKKRVKKKKKKRPKKVDLIEIIEKKEESIIPSPTTPHFIK